MSLLDYFPSYQLLKRRVHELQVESVLDKTRLEDQLDAIQRENEWLRSQIDEARYHERTAREAMTNVVWRANMGFSPYPDSIKPPEPPVEALPQRPKSNHYMESVKEGHRLTAQAIEDWKRKTAERLAEERAKLSRRAQPPESSPVDETLTDQVRLETEELVG